MQLFPPQSIRGCLYQDSVSGVVQTERVCLLFQTISTTNGSFIWPHAVLSFSISYREISLFGSHCYASAIIGLF